MAFLRLIVALMLGAWLATTAWAAVEDGEPDPEKRRLAIVIGNSDYENDRYPDLANAANDARSISASLKRLNFEVVTGIDVSSRDWNDILADVEKRLDRYGAVIIFYAGHGVQFQGENYLLPVDALEPKDMQNLTSNSVKLNEIINRLASRERQTFVFLDACRNNPLGDGATADGLAQVEVGENTFVAFATEPGKVTADGTGDNSPFTTAILKNIEIPGLSISDMMIRVRNDTEALTVGRQVPWDQSNLREQFYFTEQQVIDSATLSSSLSQILANPTMKEKLLVELASTDLQTAVFIVGEQMRSVSVTGDGSPMPPAAAAPAQAGVQVASLPAANGAGAQQNVVSDLKTLIVGTASGGTEEAVIDVARNVQTELRRLGCYRMSVDGDWGKGSRRALEDYYRFSRQDAGTLEPTVDLLGELFLRTGRVCKWKEAVKPKAVRTTSVQGDAPAATSKKAKGKSSTKKPAAARKAAPPPPDISSGIGIGGVF